MIITKDKSGKIAYFVRQLNPDYTHPDSRFISLYLHKALSCVNTVEEAIEYCSSDFVNLLDKVSILDKRVYPLHSLQKDRFFELFYYYKGLNTL